MDPDLDRKFLASLSKYCHNRTVFYLGIPTAHSSQLWFNAHRIYNQKDILHLIGTSFVWKEVFGMFSNLDVKPPFCTGDTIGPYRFRSDYNPIHVSFTCQPPNA